MDEMTINGIRCVVRVLDLPHTVHGLTTTDAEGTANIYLNARLSRQQQKDALKHELDHVRQNDVLNDLPISEVELL